MLAVINPFGVIRVKPVCASCVWFRLCYCFLFVLLLLLSLPLLSLFVNHPFGGTYTFDINSFELIDRPNSWTFFFCTRFSSIILISHKIWKNTISRVSTKFSYCYYYYYYFGLLSFVYKFARRMFRGSDRLCRFP